MMSMEGSAGMTKRGKKKIQIKNPIRLMYFKLSLGNLFPSDMWILILGVALIIGN